MRPRRRLEILCEINLSREFKQGITNNIVVTKKLKLPMA